MTQPELLEDVRSALAGYPALHLYLLDDGAEIRGTFPVLGADREVVDEYRVKIELSATYPNDLPSVRETGGRIPWTDKHHVQKDGECCVMLEDARHEEFPVGAPFGDYLAGPLRNYFIGQSEVLDGRDWPFGEWDHQGKGRFEYYSELLGTADPAVVRGFLEVIAWPNGGSRRRCPCGSGRRLSSCCLDKVKGLRRRVPRETARSAFKDIGFHRRGFMARLRPRRGGAKR